MPLPPLGAPLGLTGQPLWANQPASSSARDPVSRKKGGRGGEWKKALDTNLASIYVCTRGHTYIPCTDMHTQLKSKYVLYPSKNIHAGQGGAGVTITERALGSALFGYLGVWLRKGLVAELRLATNLESCCLCSSSSEEVTGM